MVEEICDNVWRDFMDVYRKMWECEEVKEF